MTCAPGTGGARRVVPRVVCLLTRLAGQLEPSRNGLHACIRLTVLGACRSTPGPSMRSAPPGLSRSTAWRKAAARTKNGLQSAGSSCSVIALRSLVKPVPVQLSMQVTRHALARARKSERLTHRRFVMLCPCCESGTPDMRNGTDERPLLLLARNPGSERCGEEHFTFFDGRAAEWRKSDAVVFWDSIPPGATGKVPGQQLRISTGTTACRPDMQARPIPGFIPSRR